VRWNTSNGNGDSGITIGQAGAQLNNNTANDNGQIGIDAVVGTIDNGGNTATGNGVQDCFVVLC
jgi:hypothetical protein